MVCYFLKISDFTLIYLFILYDVGSDLIVSKEPIKPAPISNSILDKKVNIENKTDSDNDSVTSKKSNLNGP